MKGILTICLSLLLALTLVGCAGQQTALQAEYIGLEAAKALALEAAGVPAASVSFSGANLDQRDGVNYYEVDFTYDGQQYQYDIDAVTGVVIEHTEAAVSAQPQVSVAPAASNGVQSVTADQAKQIALTNAGLSADQVSWIRCELEWDDGRQVYDVEFYCGSTEYDYEIDAATGEVLQFDYDAEHAVTPAASGTQSVTADQAKEKALAQVPGATVNDIYEFETDYDDGRLQYEGKIIYDGMEYEFEIDGYSGSIREWESERFGY